jgi:hypothetical protein
VQTAIAILSFVAAVDVAAATYDLTVRVGAAQRQIGVEGRVTFIAGPPLRLILSKRMHSPRFEVVEPSGIALRERVAHERGENVVWTFRTDRPVPSGTRVTMSFAYEGSGETANQYHIGPDVSFASAFGTDWYPLVDTGSDRGTGRLRFHIAPGHDVVATGRRVADRRTASERVISYDVQHATYFGFASGAFHLHTRDASMPIKAYLLKERANAEDWLEGVGAVAAALEKEFGAYPFEELSFVEVPRDVAQAASFNAAALQGFILMNHRAFDVPNVSLLWEWIGHEIAHIWWPHYLGFGRPGGRFMEEAIAEYGGLRVVEALGGPDAARQFRVSGYAPDPIYSAAAYFRLVDSGVDHPLGALQSLPGHHDIAYNKGFMFFHMLSRKIGREGFRNALRRAATASAYQEVRWWKFLSEIERLAGVDLTTFYEQWLHREGTPAWSLEWRNADGAVEVSVTQTAPPYSLDLPVRITLDDGRVIETEMHIDTIEETTVVRTASRVTNVEIDPDFHVLRRPSAPSP